MASKSPKALAITNLFRIWDLQLFAHFMSAGNSLSRASDQLEEAGTE